MSALTFLISSCASIDPAKANNQKTLTDLIKHFQEEGIVIESIAPLRSDLINANSAIAAEIAGRQIGLYKFDVTQKKEEKKLNMVKASNCLYVVGVKFPAKINGAFVMIDYEKNPKSEKIVEAFESF